jgi:hypothetical protein
MELKFCSQLDGDEAAILVRMLRYDRGVWVPRLELKRCHVVRLTAMLDRMEYRGLINYNGAHSDQRYALSDEGRALARLYNKFVGGEEFKVVIGVKDEPRSSYYR